MVEKLKYFYGKEMDVSKSGKSTKQEKISQTRTSEQKIFELNVSEIVSSIREHIDEQPVSVQELFNHIDKGSVNADIFSKAYQVGGYNFLFTKKTRTNSYVLCLVQDTKNVHAWKSRGFHFSNSDHQFKMCAGQRDNGNIMKGDEDNPLHHYVQSGKIAKELYKLFDTLDIVNDDKCTGLTNHLPDFETHKFENEFELKEKFLELKNPEWSAFQKKSQDFYYRDYKNLVQYAFNDPKDTKLIKDDGSFLRCEEYLNNQKKKGVIIDHRLEQILHERQEITKLWKGLSDDSFKNRDDLYKEFYRRHHQWQRDYSEKVGEYIREQFEAPMPKNMIPDFVLSKRSDTYDKIDTSSQNPKSYIHIEEYKVTSQEGDELVFAMAYNDAGQVYIDNIYDPRVGMNDYGIQKQIVNMGHLVYKPEDYNDQTYGISKQDKKGVDKNYDDITALWERIPVVKKFKEELVKRGIVKIF